MSSMNLIKGLSSSDKWFFAGIFIYLIVGLPNLYFKWFSIDLLIFVWIIYLGIGAVNFNLFPSWFTRRK